jgi:hypothetical protein
MRVGTRRMKGTKLTVGDRDIPIPNILTQQILLLLLLILPNASAGGRATTVVAVSFLLRAHAIHQGGAGEGEDQVRDAATNEKWYRTSEKSQPKPQREPYLILIIQRRHRRLRVRDGSLGFGELLVQIGELGGGIGSVLGVKESERSALCTDMTRNEGRRQWGR